MKFVVLCVVVVEYMIMSGVWVAVVENVIMSGVGGGSGNCDNEWGMWW